MNKETLQYSTLKSGQKKAFFSFDKIRKNSELQIDNLCKTISAMANAIGGEIFIGIEIEKTKFIAWEKKPTDFPSAEILLSLIQEQIQPIINNLKIDNLEDGFYISVPNSRQKPHISLNYKYYKRVLSKNQVMEEFEVRHLYHSSAKSSLKILDLTALQGVPIMVSGKFEEMKFYPRIHIQNLGQKMEKYYKLELSIPSNLVDPNFTVLHKYLKGYDLNTNIYSIPSSEPLFQMETKTVVELVIKVNANNYTTFTDSSIGLKLYSTEGIHEQDYRLSDWLHYKGQLPQLNSFVKKIEE